MDFKENVLCETRQYFFFIGKVKVFGSPTRLLEEESQPTQEATRRLQYLHDKDLRITSLLGIKSFCNERSNT